MSEIKNQSSNEAKNVNKSKPLLCDASFEKRNSLGFMEYPTCNCVAKFKIEFFDLFDKKDTVFIRCGKHKNQIEKWLIKRKFNYNIESIT